MTGRIGLSLVALLLATNLCRADGARPKGNLDPIIAEADRELLVQAAAIGSMSPVQTTLMIIRLYAIQVPGECVPGRASVCAYRYLLVTSSRKKPPVMKAYDLGQLGEITGMKFSGKEDDPYFTLELSVQNFPRAAVKSNRRLAVRKKTITLQVDPNQVVQED